MWYNKVTVFFLLKDLCEHQFDIRGRAIVVALTVAPAVTGEYNGFSLSQAFRIADARGYRLTNILHDLRRDATP